MDDESLEGFLIFVQDDLFDAQHRASHIDFQHTGDECVRKGRADELIRADGFESTLVEQRQRRFRAKITGLNFQFQVRRNMADGVGDQVAIDDAHV